MCVCVYFHIKFLSVRYARRKFLSRTSESKDSFITADVVCQLTRIPLSAVRDNIDNSYVIEGDGNDTRANPPIVSPRSYIFDVYRSRFDGKSYRWYSETYHLYNLSRLLVSRISVRVPFPRMEKPLPLDAWCRESIEQRVNGGL